MNNYRATPLTTTAPERAEEKQKQKQAEPEVMIVHWDIHENELPEKQETQEGK